MKYSVLVLGASYGSLFGTKLLMAGHRVASVCTKPTADLINREGTVVRFPIRGRPSPVDISSKKLPGALSATTPDQVNPREFDLIVLDPPSFTRNRASVPDALRGYKEIHLRALKLLKPGGTLATFCCSHHVDAGLFQDTVLSAAYDARKILRRVATYTQSPDHPIIPMIPETEYLKGFAFEVVR